MAKEFYVYILSNKYQTVFYTGVTSNLIQRIYQHKNKMAEGFTKKYNIDWLVYFEQHQDSMSAISREKQIKDFRRSKKIILIRDVNPRMKDLYPDLVK